VAVAQYQLSFTIDLAKPKVGETVKVTGSVTWEAGMDPINKVEFAYRKSGGGYGEPITFTSNATGDNPKLTISGNKATFTYELTVDQPGRWELQGKGYRNAGGNTTIDAHGNGEFDVEPIKNEVPPES
jgi:hypothetical protein